MRYYIGTVANFFNEREFHTPVRFCTTGEPYDALHAIAKTFWGKSATPTNSIYSDEAWDFGDIIVAGEIHLEVTKEEFDKMFIFPHLGETV